MTCQVSIQLLAVEPDVIEVTASRCNGETARYRLELSKFDHRLVNEIVGAFVFGLLRLRDPTSFSGDPVQNGYAAVLDMTMAGLPEIDYLAFMAMQAKSAMECNPQLLQEAEKYLRLAADKGWEPAIVELQRSPRRAQ